MKTFNSYLAVFGLLISLSTVAQQPGSAPAANRRGAGMPGLVMPKEIKTIDNSTSIVLNNLSTENKQLTELPKDSGLELIKDLVYHQSKDLNGNPLPMKMDIIKYTDGKKRPCVVFITGGGFMFAPKTSSFYNRSQIATGGFVVASIEYHVIANGIYSDAVKDVKAAIRYLRANANQYGIDPAHMAVWGESAGGYLTAMVGTTNGVKDFEEGENLEQSSNVQAAIDVFGLSDLTKIGADYDEAAEKAHFTLESPDGQYIHGKNSGLTSLDKPEVVAKSNPINYVDKNDPPFLLIHGMVDALVSPSQTLLLHTALRKAGVPSTRYVLTGANHGGPQFSDPNVIKIMIDFLQKNLK